MDGYKIWVTSDALNSELKPHCQRPAVRGRVNVRMNPQITDKTRDFEWFTMCRGKRQSAFLASMNSAGASSPSVKMTTGHRQIVPMPGVKNGTEEDGGRRGIFFQAGGILRPAGEKAEPDWDLISLENNLRREAEWGVDGLLAVRVKVLLDEQSHVVISEFLACCHTFIALTTQAGLPPLAGPEEPELPHTCPAVDQVAGIVCIAPPLSRSEGTPGGVHHPLAEFFGEQ